MTAGSLSAVAYRTMRDSVTATDLKLMIENGDPIPDAFGGYDDGKYADAPTIRRMFPDTPVLAFTVNPADNEGDVLDVENGDATVQEAPAWVVKRRAAGHTWVTCYCSLATYPALRAVFIQSKIPEPWYIVAAYPGSGPTVPNLPNVVGHQFADRGPYDESVLLPTYPLFPQPKPAPEPPGVTTPISGGHMRTLVIVPTDNHGNGSVICDGDTGACPGVTSVSPAIDSADVLSVCKQGSNPPANGYWPGDVGWQDHGGFPLVTVTGADVDSHLGVFITV